jgi:hypothetical protein
MMTLTTSALGVLKMANESLAALPLSRNDVSSFANLINETLQTYCANYSPLEREYLLALRTVVGLSFTAALVCESWISVCEPHLMAFLEHREYKRQAGASAHLSLAVAELVNDAAYLFRIIRFPRYYDDFLKALKHIMRQMGLALREKSEEVDRLAKLILPLKN